MGEVSAGSARCDRVRVEEAVRDAPAERDPVFTLPVRPGAAVFVREREVGRDEDGDEPLPFGDACERVPRRDPSLAVMAYLLPKLSNGRIRQELFPSLSRHRHLPCPPWRQLQLPPKQGCSRLLCYVRA